MNGASWGGSEELWFRTALYAAHKGWKVGCAVYYWPGKENRLKELSAAGCKIYYLPNKGKEQNNLYQRIQFKITKKIRLKNAARSLPVKDYELVVINQGEFEIISSAWKSFYTRLDKYALLFHNYKEGQILKPAKAIILKHWIDKAAINLFASKRIKEVLELQLEKKNPNAGILLNPITFVPPSFTTTPAELKHGNYNFIMLAALETNRKAQDMLITALSSAKWKERNWTLYLYGEGKDKQLLKCLIKENDLSAKIFLAGHVEDVKAALENAHLVLQVTHMDAMPLSVVEAMAMSRPVVVSNIGDMPLWVRENENGWISKDASVEEIDKTLERAWTKRTEWTKMGERGFAIFKEKFPSSPEQYFLSQLRVE